MRDDRMKWAPAGRELATFEGDGFRFQCVTMQSQALVSASDILTRMPDALGWPDVICGQSYVLSLRRDRVLVVNGPFVQDGWDSELSQAVSDVTDALTVFEISGPNTLALMRRGAEISFEAPSRSASRLLFGFGVFAYRYESHDTVRVHVNHAHSDAFAQALRQAATRMQATLT